MFIAKASGVEKISNMLNQWQIQGKKIETAPPPPYLRVWMNGP